MFYIALGISVLGNVIYHITQKSIAPNAHPLISVVVSYCVSIVACAVVYPFFPASEPLGVELRALNWATYVLGVGIVGPEAADLISEAALALEMCAYAEDVHLTVHPHPTLGEAMMESFKHALGEAIHIGNR